MQYAGRLDVPFLNRWDHIAPVHVGRPKFRLPMPQKDDGELRQVLSRLGVDPSLKYFQDSPHRFH
jgi:hypothetical protein